MTTEIWTQKIDPKERGKDLMDKIVQSLTQIDHELKHLKSDETQNNRRLKKKQKKVLYNFVIQFSYRKKMQTPKTL